jgi:4-hydroxy-tetrahydrodipicolinate synthase
MSYQNINRPVWTALVTPLTATGQPDMTSFEGLLREQEEAGNGVLILGSTGEALNLSPEERRLVVEFTTSLDLQVPVMAGVGGHHLPDIISWLCYLETRAIDAYLMVTPLYAKPGREGQFHWFSTLMDFVSRPVMLYNIPGRTGAPLNLETVERLHDHRNFWSIKEASGSVDDYLDYRRASNGAVMFSGDDVMLPDFAAHGAAGVVSVAANVWPRATRLYSEMAVAGTLTDDDIALWRRAAGSLFVASNPVPAKAVLAAEGRIRTPEVKLPLHRNDMTSLDMVRGCSEEIGEWYRAQASEHAAGRAGQATENAERVAEQADAPSRR